MAVLFDTWIDMGPLTSGPTTGSIIMQVTALPESMQEEPEVFLLMVLQSGCR